MTRLSGKLRIYPRLGIGRFLATPALGAAKITITPIIKDDCDCDSNEIEAQAAATTAKAAETTEATK